MQIVLHPSSYFGFLLFIHPLLTNLQERLYCQCLRKFADKQIKFAFIRALRVFVAKNKKSRPSKDGRGGLNYAQQKGSFTWLSQRCAT